MNTHDIRTTGDRQRGFRAHCQTHDCWALDNHHTADQAYAAFKCDDGSNARFIVQFDDAPPCLTDLSGLKGRVRSFARDRAYGHGGYDNVQVWRWLGDGRLERLTVGRKTSGQFDEHDWAYPTWAATGPDGADHLLVEVRIDGRA